MMVCLLRPECVSEAFNPSMSTGKLRKRASPVSLHPTGSHVQRSQPPTTNACASSSRTTSPTVTRPQSSVIQSPRPTSSVAVATRASHPSIEPRSAAEQYWAARALTAETLLSARLTHHEELRSAVYLHDVKRSVSPCNIRLCLPCAKEGTSRRVVDMIRRGTLLRCQRYTRRCRLKWRDSWLVGILLPHATD